MTSTILHSIQPAFIPHPGRCYVCFETTDSPYCIMYIAEYNDKVKLCTKICLDKFRKLDEVYKAKENIQTKKEVVKPKPVRVGKPQPHIKSLSIKAFNSDDLKIEDIEDLDLSKV